MSAGEFELIDAMLDALGGAANGPGVVVGPGDDSAVLQVPDGHQLIVSTDTLVAGRHFPASAPAELIGYRGLAVATSDLAAMGARPAWATIALTSDGPTEEWARGYAGGVAAAAGDFGLAVVGGNVARGPASITVTVHGHAPAGRALLRSGAAPGDTVFVTGRLGGARLALAEADLVAPGKLARLAAESALGRYWKPQPRIELGIALRGVASAAIDISDGLSSDLEHLCRASGVGARVDLGALPTFPGCPPRDAASAGDDYELAFTAPPDSLDHVRSVAAGIGVAATAIGVVVEASAGIRWQQNGEAVDVQRGYRHF